MYAKSTITVVDSYYELSARLKTANRLRRRRRQTDRAPARASLSIIVRVSGEQSVVISDARPWNATRSYCARPKFKQLRPFNFQHDSSVLFVRPFVRATERVCPSIK